MDSSGMLGIIMWCPEAESNHRHEDFQSSALPTELSGHICVATCFERPARWQSVALHLCSFQPTIIDRCRFGCARSDASKPLAYTQLSYLGISVLLLALSDLQDGKALLCTSAHSSQRS